MLTKFTVENFKNFKTTLEFDFEASSYEFNKEALFELRK